MDSNMLGGVMLTVWNGQGLKVEKVNDQFDECTFWITVPETSHNVSADGNMMAGSWLAKRFKEVIREMSGDAKKITVKYKIRSGDQWTPEKQAAAEKATKGALYNGWVK